MGKLRVYAGATTRIIIVGIAGPLLALLAHSIFMQTTTTPPPADYGTGSMFDSIAPRYDFINRVLALNMDTSWRRAMVAEVFARLPSASNYQNCGAPACVEPMMGNVKILDLATGTADVAILLAEKIQGFQTVEENSRQNAQIYGVDPSEKMIQVGQAKLESRDLHQVVQLDIGDARDLSQFNNQTFDAVTMAFGIRNVPPGEERKKALCEIHRVLKKTNVVTSNQKAMDATPKSKSIFAILEFSEPGPEYAILGAIARFFIRYIVPSLGAILSGAPREYRHLQNSIDQFEAPAEFVETLENLKCVASRDTRVSTEITEDDAQLGDRIGTFKVDKVHHMNGGSVQLYVITPEIVQLH